MVPNMTSFLQQEDQGFYQADKKRYKFWPRKYTLQNYYHQLDDVAISDVMKKMNKEFIALVILFIDIIRYFVKLKNRKNMSQAEQPLNKFLMYLENRQIIQPDHNINQLYFIEFFEVNTNANQRVAA